MKNKSHKEVPKGQEQDVNESLLDPPMNMWPSNLQLLMHSSYVFIVNLVSLFEDVAFGILFY